MAEVLQKIVITGDKGSLQVMGAFDLEVMETYVRRDVAERVGALVPYSKRPSVVLAGRDVEIREFLAVELSIDGESVDWSCRVVDALSQEVVIGACTMRGRHIVVDQVERKAIVENGSRPDELK